MFVKSLLCFLRITHTNCEKFKITYVRMFHPHTYKGWLTSPPKHNRIQFRLQRGAVLYVFIHIYKPDDDINSWESRVFYLNHAPAYCDVWQFGGRRKLKQNYFA